MLHDQGSNDRWTPPTSFTQQSDGTYHLQLRESLGKHWASEIVSWPLPEACKQGPLQVTLDGEPVTIQLRDGRLYLHVLDLAPGECRCYHLQKAPGVPAAATSIHVEDSHDTLVMDNGHIAVKLPLSLAGRVVPGPILAIRRTDQPWIGAGRLETSTTPESLHTRIAEQGPLWTAAIVEYTFPGGAVYRTRIELRPEDSHILVEEESSLPVHLWPAPRPYKEIGTLGKSHWDRPIESVGVPCIRPFPSSNFVFDLRQGWAPDRLQTHSTAAWEIMDLPLMSPVLKTHTAMRAAYPGIDAGWMNVYDSSQPYCLGVASIDLAHWKMPDDTVHPVHRTPGANAEVVLLDSAAEGSWLRLPIENMSRRWLLAITHRAPHPDAESGRPLRLEADPRYPPWALRTRLGDLSLEKVKNWVTAWPESDLAHPRVFCGREEFGDIRARIERVPEFKHLWETTRHLRPADRYIVAGEGGRLSEVEQITKAGELIASTLERGYLGPHYAIGLARPLRRYAMACDLLWESFTLEEQIEARRVCSLAAYIMTDGDWWQYAFRDGETTYLPNFNCDVYTCAGLIGLLLADHPSADVWVQACVRRLEIELDRYLRADGTGEENLGSYLVSTWIMLYMPILWALRKGGIRDYSGDARIHAGARFLLHVLTPPDPRENGLRMTPPIGHHPNARKSFPIMSQLAAFVRDADPQLAAELMWGWKITGSTVGNLYDHSGPTSNPLTRHYIFHDDSIEPRAPRLTSMALPHVGALFRSHDGTPHSSFLILKAGRVHSHHDEDEGSFHYYGRGVPLVLDGLRLCNGATVEEHNVVSFARRGQPTAWLEHFVTDPVADYVRVAARPRAYACDAMYLDELHRSGFVREIVMVKAPQAGGVEYLVVKDTCTGPDATQWNIDVLSAEPCETEPGRIWFPGHPELDMGLDVIVAEPFAADARIEAGPISKDLLTPEGLAALPERWVKYDLREHWLLHVPSTPGATFVTVLFPRPASEMAPLVTYMAREETLHIQHADGSDIIFLRPNPHVPIALAGIVFRGRVGVLRERDSRALVSLDAEEMSSGSGSVITI